MIIRKLRLKKGWSQEQLAQMSGLSVRTIQRIERGKRAGLESLKALGAVFETDLTHLYEEPEMTTQDVSLNEHNMTWEEQKAFEYVRDVKGFYSHLITFLVTIAGLFVFNLIVSPSYLWVFWAIFGWGIGLISHGVSVFEVFNFFGADWEKRQVEKRLKRKL